MFIIHHYIVKLLTAFLLILTCRQPSCGPAIKAQLISFRRVDYGSSLDLQRYRTAQTLRNNSDKRQPCRSKGYYESSTSSLDCGCQAIRGLRNQGDQFTLPSEHAQDYRKNFRHRSVVSGDHDLSAISDSYSLGDKDNGTRPHLFHPIENRTRRQAIPLPQIPYDGGEFTGCPDRTPCPIA